MRRFRRFRPGVLPGWLRWTVLVSAVSYLLLRLVELTLLAPLTLVAEQEARLRAIDAVNRIVLGSVGNSVSHGDLITYEKDQQGRIAAYHLNTRAINQIASEAATAVRSEFDKLSEERFEVPAGALAGSRLFATLGPRFSVGLMPIGTVTIDIKHDFTGEGINQTRHRIWLHALARVRVILPLISQEVEVTSDLPISETVIIGPVPGSFYGGNLGGVTLPARP